MTSLNLFDPALNNPEDSWQTTTNTKRLDYKTQQITNNHQFLLNDQKPNQNLNDLFVFGYACKLFRDDTAALKLDNDLHLIPWNGDTSLLIDRYDCRGYLFDLSECDADLINKTQRQQQMQTLTEDEEEIERLCDEERYLSLNKCLEDEALHQEEELKRFYAEQQQYGAVGLSYDTPVSNDQIVEETSSVKVESKDTSKQSKLQSFIPSEQLQLPVGMLIPDTIKQNSLIEKTANFVAKQGLQMEILIKTKQSANVQFNFLDFDHHLNPYYRYLVGLIKTNKYQPKIVESESDSDSNTDDDDEGYLHPSLLAASKPAVQANKIPNEVNQPQVAFKPNIKDTAYSHLIQKFSEYSAKIQKAQEEEQQRQLRAQYESLQAMLAQAPPPPPPSAPSTTESSQEQATVSLISDEDDKVKIPEYIKVPLHDDKQVIDKLADYVTRNGQEFEECIKRKNDARFEFLNSTSPFYNYYQFKLLYYQAKKKSREVSAKFKTSENNNAVLQKILAKLSSKQAQTASGLSDLDDSSNDSASRTANGMSLESKPANTDEVKFNRIDEDIEMILDATTASDASTDRPSTSKELQEKRKLKAALFLSMIQNKASDEVKVEVGQEETRERKSSSRGRRRRSRSRSRSKRRRDDRKCRSRTRSRGRHRKCKSRSPDSRSIRKHRRSRTRSRSNTEEEVSSHRRHQHSSSRRHNSRSDRSRSHSRHGHYHRRHHHHHRHTGHTTSAGRRRLHHKRHHHHKKHKHDSRSPSKPKQQSAESVAKSKSKSIEKENEQAKRRSPSSSSSSSSSSGSNRSENNK